MGKAVMPLTDKKIKSARPSEKLQRLSDGDGLYITVKPTGSKLWRLDYILDGKRNTVSLGKYPEVSLAKARELRGQYRERIAAGLPPIEKKTVETRPTVDEGADEFFERLTKEVGEKYHYKLKQRYKSYIGNTIGSMVMDEVTPSDIVKMVNGVGDKWETAKRVHGIAGRIFSLAVTLGHAIRNPVNDVDIAVLVGKIQTKHYAHVTEAEELGAILKTIDTYEGDASTTAALQLLPYLFARPANIRLMEPRELDLERGIWKIPKEKMKMKRDHIVPLAKQVVERLKMIVDFDKPYVFHSPLSHISPLSENTLNYAMIRLGFKDVQTAHGFRHTASTLAHEHMHEIEVAPEVIEAQLAHEKGGIAGIYNHAKYLKERIRLMQWWADYLDALKQT
jgi:integrase